MRQSLPLEPHPDCDTVRVRGDMAAAPQLDAPDRDPPEGGSVLSQDTDCYKPGWFALRCPTPDRYSKSPGQSPATS